MTAESPPISIVIPTAGRAGVLAPTLSALRDDAPDGAELLVAVEAGDAASASAAAGAGAEVLEVPAGAGPAAARNAVIARARSELCLLCDDDVRPRPGMIAAHAAFHSEHPGQMVALMGLVVPEPPLDRSEFQRWLHTGGIQFGYGRIRPGAIDGRYLWVANASFKRAGLAAVGGFDEQIGFGSEDADLGSRFVAAGGRIIYRDDVVGLHHRPTTLAQTLARMRRVGEASRDHPPRLAARTRPRRTEARHRLALSGLGAAERAGLLRGPLRRAAWRALCKQAYREGYWDEGSAGERGGSSLRHGAALARRLAARMAADDPWASP